jgi:DNA mismatch repair protein MutL
LEQAAAVVGQALRGAERSARGLKLLGQAQDAYLVCQKADGICILDQHAADEVSTFLRLSQAYRSGGLQSQSLLFPSALKLSKRETELIDKRSALLLRLGLDVRVRSEGAVSLHGIMGLLKRATPEATIAAFLEAARGTKEESALVTRFLSILACQEAVPCGTSLGLGDAGMILKGLSGVDLEVGIAECQHGRPLLSVTSFSELARKAQR